MAKVPSPARILVVDDSMLVREGIRLFIEMHTDWKVCGEAENGKKAIAMAETLKPDLVILDLSMPIMNGLDAAKGISAVFPSMPMIMFTLHYSHTLLKQAQLVGISHVFSKGDGLGENVLKAMSAMLVTNSQSNSQERQGFAS
jgi:DNA-binding NarL/FixJ family response regulator